MEMQILEDVTTAEAAADSNNNNCHNSSHQYIIKQTKQKYSNLN